MHRLLAFSAALVLVSACGGPSASKALEHKVSDKHLAPVPIADRGSLRDAVKANFLAEWQVRYTEYAIGEARSDVKVARNDVKKVKLESKSLNIEKKHAKKNAQTSAASAVDEQGQRNKAELGACKARVAAAKQKVKYLKARLKAERHQLRETEAKIEVIKAQSMAAAGVKPPGFDLGKYKAQHKRREAQIKSEMAVANREKKALAGLEAKAKQCRQAGAGKVDETVPDGTPTKTPPALEDDPPPSDPPPSDPPPADPKPADPKPEPPPTSESPSKGEDADPPAAPAKPQPSGDANEDPEEEEQP